MTLTSLLLLASPAHAAINVAVVADDSTSHDDVAAQLDDDTWFDFETTTVAAADIDSADELAAYDVVVMGDSGYQHNEWDEAFASALADWVDAGGGVVMTGWLDYAINSGTEDVDLDDVCPVDLNDSGYHFCDSNLDLDLTGVSHPITDGLPASIDLGTTSYVEYTAVDLDLDGAEALATLDFSESTYCATADETKSAVVASAYGDGRTVFLGPIYMANSSSYLTSDLRSGDPDQLFEQAVAWAASSIDETDADGDGFDSVADGGFDCNDEDATVYPGAPETWYDGIDSDCGSDSDFDADGDGQDSSDHSGLDCDDADASVYDGAVETWYDGVDTDCAGDSDYDADGDTYDSADHGGDDCDDADDGIHPGATDIEDDGIDQDCDGSDATSGGGDDGGTDSGGDGGTDGSTDGGTDGGTDGDAGGDTGGDDGDDGDDDTKGCASAGAAPRGLAVILLGALGLIGLRRRD